MRVGRSITITGPEQILRMCLYERGLHWGIWRLTRHCIRASFVVRSRSRFVAAIPIVTLLYSISLPGTDFYEVLLLSHFANKVEINSAICAQQAFSGCRFFPNNPHLRIGTSICIRSSSFGSVVDIAGPHGKVPNPDLCRHNDISPNRDAIG